MAMRRKAEFEFLSTPSARRATRKIQKFHRHEYISIHALREEGDFLVALHKPCHKDFYPRPPRGGRQSPLPRPPAPF